MPNNNIIWSARLSLSEHIIVDHGCSLRHLFMFQTCIFLVVLSSIYKP